MKGLLWCAITGLMLAGLAVALSFQAHDHDQFLRRVSERQCVALNSLLLDARARRISERLSMRPLTPAELRALVRIEDLFLDAYSQCK